MEDTDSAGALYVAEELRKKIKSLKIAHDFSPVAAWITVSIGVASVIPKSDIPSHVLVEEADKALFAAKAAGRNRVVCQGGE